MNPKPLRHVDLFSSAGKLEALYRDLQDPAAVAVVCHPHPLGGGTLHNKVVFRAARGLEAANVATLRFNFRGTGNSAGHHEGGEGEQGDVVAAIDWLIKNVPNHNGKVGIWGISYPGFFAAHSLMNSHPALKAVLTAARKVPMADTRGTPTRPNLR